MSFENVLLWSEHIGENAETDLYKSFLILRIPRFSDRFKDTQFSMNVQFIFKVPKHHYEDSYTQSVL